MERLLRRTGAPMAVNLYNNDSYHALKRVDALVKTGPTGTKVNDVMVLLVEGK